MEIFALGRHIETLNVNRKFSDYFTHAKRRAKHIPFTFIKNLNWEIIENFLIPIETFPRNGISVENKKND